MSRDQARLKTLASVNDDIILMADPRVAGIPVEECGEPLLDLNVRGFVRIDGRQADPAGDWRQLRAGMIDRLAHAARLLPAGLRLLHLEGYRPPLLQEKHFVSYRDELAALRPELDSGALDRLASRYVSPPEIAPHSAVRPST